MSSCALLLAYDAWFLFNKPVALRIEGKEPISIAEFGKGVTVRHAFVMPVDGLSDVSVKMSADQSSTLTIFCRLLESSDDSDGRSDEHAEIYRWTERLTVRSGEGWYRVEFPAIGGSKDRWYAVDMRLLDATPTRGPKTAATRPVVSIAASRDNPRHGGKLWVDGLRQPGSLFLRAHERSEDIHIAVLLACPWALVPLIWVIFFARGDELATRQAPTQSNSRAVSLRSQVPLIVTCIAGLFVPLLIPLATRRVLTRDDLSNLHLPLRYLYWSALHSGDSVLWTSALFAGFDLHGEGQVGMAHPFHFLIYRLLPLDIAYNFELIANYVGGVAGMRLLLPRFGLSREGAWFGAMVFAFSGFNLLHLMHLNVIGIMSHAPWMLLATHVLMTSIDRRARAAAFVGVVLLVASQVFLGHHQFVWMTLLATACLALWLAFVEGTPSRLLPLSGAIVCGVLISAVQLLPTLDSLNASNRAAPSLDFRMAFSLTPVSLIQWVSPYLHGFGAFGDPELFVDLHEYSWYDGAFAALAVAWVAIRGRALAHRRFAWAVLVFTAMGVILSLGSYGGLYQWLSELPILDKFRAPGRHVVLVHLALSGIAAAVFDDLVGLIRRGEKFPARRCRPFVPIAVVSVGTVVFYASGDGLAASDVIVAGVWSGIMAVTALLLVLAGWGQRWAIASLVILAAIDLGGWGYRYIYQGRPETISDIAASASIPPDARPGALLNLLGISRNRVILRDMRVWDAYVGLPPAGVLPKRDVTSERLAGVEWRRNSTGWTRVPDPMPRARLIASARQTERVASEVREIDPARVALLDRPMADLSGAPGSARILVDRPGRIEVETSAPGRQLLVLTERFHQGWRATADGRDLETLSVYGTYLGCVVNPGTSRIQFVFAPRSLTVGIAVTLGGLVLTAAIAGVMGWKPRSRADCEHITDRLVGPVDHRQGSSR